MTSSLSTDTTAATPASNDLPASGTSINMPLRGRPRLDLTEEERTQARREQVRRHMQTYRQRLKEERVKKRPKTENEFNFVIVEEPWRYSKGSPGGCRGGGRGERGQKREEKKLDPTLANIEKVTIEQQSTFRLSMTISEGSVSKDSFFSALISRYLPYIETEEPDSSTMLKQLRHDGKVLPVPCSTWLVLACDAPPDNESSQGLKESILSMSLCLVSTESNEDNSSRDLITAGLRAYQRAIRIIQKNLALSNKLLLEARGARKRVGRDAMACIGYLLLACLACAMTEMMIDRSSHINCVKHLEGMATLIQQCGPESLRDSAVLRAAFYEHRTMYVAFCFLDRRDCFYGRREWIDFEWREEEKQARTHMQTMLDIGYPIPGMLEKFDMLSKVPSSSTAPIMQMREMLHMANDLDAALQRWWKLRVERPSLNISIITTREYDDAAQTDLPFLPPSNRQMRFVNLALAVSLCYYHAIRIYCLHLISDIAHHLAEHDDSLQQLEKRNLRARAREGEDQAFDEAVSVCEAITYFVDTRHDTVGILGLMWPFDAAWIEFLRPPKAGEQGMREEDRGQIDTRERQKAKDKYLAFCLEAVERFVGLGLRLLNDRRNE